ncbi:hypothetical protein Pelo_9440 [Pelomyxa schiedti]|nr:hypothetical protein Pelo_9440 [Pelomyxa schiedti]
MSAADVNEDVAMSGNKANVGVKPEAGKDAPSVDITELEEYKSDDESAPTAVKDAKVDAHKNKIIMLRDRLDRPPQVVPSKSFRMTTELSSQDQFVAFATGALVPRCGRRDGGCAVALMAKCPSLVAEFGRLWVVSSSRIAAFTIHPRVTNKSTVGSNSNDYQTVHVFMNISALTLGVSQCGWWDGKCTGALSENSQYVRGCIGYDRFVVTTFSARNGCWAGIVDHSGKVFSILYQVKDGVVIGKEGNEISTATQAPTVFIDHRFERVSQTCLSFSRDNPNVLLCCVPPAEFGGHFDLWHIDLEKTMKRGKKSLVVSKEVPIPENIAVTGITAAEPVCVMSSTWAFNSTTGERHHYDNVLGVRAIGDRNIGAMHAEQPYYSIMDVYSTDNLNTVCLVSPVSGRHHGLHQSHEGCVVSLDTVQSHCGIVVWKVEQVTSATKLLFCDGATDVALATLYVD